MLRHMLPNKRMGLSAEIAELEARIATEVAALGEAVGWRQKAEIRRRIREDRKELGYVELGEINRERAFLRSGGEMMRTTVARELEGALAKCLENSSDEADRPKTKRLIGP